MKLFLRTLMTASIFLTIGCQTLPQATAIPEQASLLLPTDSSTETNVPRQVFPQTPIPTAGSNDGSADTTPVPNSTPVAQIAAEDLAKRLQIGVEKISIASIESMTWPDGSLGCPQQGMMYTQALTPGFKVILEADGKSYPYHTDENETVIFCGLGSGTEHFFAPTP